MYTITDIVSKINFSVVQVNKMNKGIAHHVRGGATDRIIR